MVLMVVIGNDGKSSLLLWVVDLNRMVVPVSIRLSILVEEVVVVIGSVDGF